MDKEMWETVLTPTLRPNDKLTLILLSSFYINMLFYPLFEKIFLINNHFLTDKFE
jgi:hypothetical protein